MNKPRAFTIASAITIVAVVGGFAAFLADKALESPRVASPIWTEVRWPFPLDQWGPGRTFQCKAVDCGSEVNLYLRAKIGFCNCATGVADDKDLDRMSDFDLVGGEVSPLSSGRPIKIGGMNGRDRVYALTASMPPGKTAISVVFNDRCDMVVATAVLAHGPPRTIEPAVIEFLNSAAVLHWAEVSLGL
jgi:hypothetical protein